MTNLPKLCDDIEAAPSERALFYAVDVERPTETLMGLCTTDDLKALVRELRRLEDGATVATFDR